MEVAVDRKASSVYSVPSPVIIDLQTFSQLHVFLFIVIHLNLVIDDVHLPK